MEGSRSEGLEGQELILRLEGVPAPAALVEFADREAERRVRSAARSGDGRRVRVAALEDSDTEGHDIATAAANAAVVRLLIDEGDTEGHALALRFPTAADAADFRKKLAQGALIGTIALAGVGAAATLAPGYGGTAAGVGAGEV
ncbi:MAG: hypothetical protein M3301_09505, partial [Chloroflexota bacterium]|nr:hypothetical protein [Chloroflexota bacterium]